MIEINLIPDVKIELLRVRRSRNIVISGAILSSIVAGGVVVLLSIYTFGYQSFASWSLDNNIKKQYTQLLAVEDLPKMLTIQNQLNELSSAQENKNITSRTFDLLTTIVPGGDNVVAISKADLDVKEGTITIEAEAENGYEALEVFKKTIAATTLQYSADDGVREPLPIATNITDKDRTFGESIDGGKVLRFTLSFEYAPELFASSTVNGRINAPNKQNATDSAKAVPKSLFTDSVKDDNEETK